MFVLVLEEEAGCRSLSSRCYVKAINDGFRNLTRTLRKGFLRFRWVRTNDVKVQLPRSIRELLVLRFPSLPLHLFETATLCPSTLPLSMCQQVSYVYPPARCALLIPCTEKERVGLYVEYVLVRVIVMGC